MIKNDLILAGYAALLVVASACFDSKEGPRAGGHTNWLKCHSLKDCEASSQAVDCIDDYCVDEAGDRIEATDDFSKDSTDGDDAGVDASDTKSDIDSGSQSVFPSSWIRIDSICGAGYSFLAPPAVSEELVMGDDTCGHDYITEACEYNSGYSWVGMSYEGMESYPDYTQSKQQIDGLDATVITARVEDPENRPNTPYFAAVDFVSDAKGNYMTMYAYCHDEAGQNEALLVFQSIILPR